MSNNGFYRCSTVSIMKYDSVGDPVAGYPVVYDMTVDFVYNGGAVLSTDIADAVDGSVGDTGTWNDMVDKFRLWVQSIEVNLDIKSDQLNVPYGKDLVTCPIAYGDYF